jgi:hypothetical protein
MVVEEIGITERQELALLCLASLTLAYLVKQSDPNPKIEKQNNIFTIQVVAFMAQTVTTIFKKSVGFSQQKIDVTKCLMIKKEKKAKAKATNVCAG